MPEITLTSSSRTVTRRHKPLADDLSTTAPLRTKTITSSTGKRKSRSFEAGSDGYIDAPSSRKILALAQELAEEDTPTTDQSRKDAAANTAFEFESRIRVDVPGEEDVESGPQEDDDDEGDWLPEEDVEEEDIDPGDLAIYNKLLPHDDQTAGFAPSLAALSTNGGSKDGRLLSSQEGESRNAQSTNLADLILQRIAEKEAYDQRKTNFKADFDDNGPSSSEIPPKVVEVFTKCGQLLSRYKSGPLPKPFKVLPTLPAWPELLNITHPESWTANAVFAATKIFVSAPPDVAQHFINTVLLDRVKEDIYETKKLNVHLYDALKKALYKPAAFFKGLLFPLVNEGCTLREANIISSVLARVSIPVLHSAAALLRLCEIAAEQSRDLNTESTGACNIFIRVLLDKKYALPYKAVDALVFHFLRFRNSKASEDVDGAISGAKNGSHKASKDEKLPILWHQSLLVFAQRYKNDITEDQREALLDLLLVRGHKDIGPEVRRELLVGRGRGTTQNPVDMGRTEGTGADDGDDTMRDVG